MKAVVELEAVIFDMDGVIVDSEPLWSEAERKLLARRNLPYLPQLKALLMGRDSQEAVALLLKHYDLRERLEDVVRERNELITELFRRSLRVMPSVLDVIRSLRHCGMKTALASSSPRPLIELVLRKLSIALLFDVVLSGDQVDRGKPAPDIYLTAARKLQVASENCLVIEDAPNGVAAAKAAGMCCLAISTSAHTSELGAADKVVGGFDEVDLPALHEVMAKFRSTRSLS